MAFKPTTDGLSRGVRRLVPGPAYDALVGRAGNTADTTSPGNTGCGGPTFPSAMQTDFFRGLGGITGTSLDLPLTLPSAPSDPLTDLWRHTHLQDFKRALLPLPALELNHHIREQITARGLWIEADQVFCLIGALGCSGAPAASATLLETLAPHAWRALQAHEASREHGAPSDPDPGSIRTACIRVIPLLAYLSAETAGAWEVHCSPVWKRLDWLACLQASSTPVSLNTFKQALRACRDHPQRPLRERLLFAIAEGIARHLPEARSVPLSNEKLVQLPACLPSSPAGNAVMRRLLQAAGYSGPGDLFLHPERRQADLEHLTLLLSELRPRTPRNGRPEAGSVHQRGGVRIVYLDGIPLNIQQKTVARIVRAFVRDRQEDHLTFFLHRSDDSARAWAKELFGRNRLTVIGDDEATITLSRVH